MPPSSALPAYRSTGSTKLREGLALSAEWVAPILQVVWIRSQRVETAWQRRIGVETASRHQDKQTLAAEVAALEATKTTGLRCWLWPISWRASVQRGNVFSLRVPEGLGHHRQGKRFGGVVQSDAILPRSVVVIAPTSRSAKPASFRPEIEIDASVSVLSAGIE